MEELAWSEAPEAAAANDREPNWVADRVRPLPRSRRRARVSSETVTATVAALDFCLVAGAGALAFYLYFGIRGNTEPEHARYVVTWLFSATLFVSLFERLGGYKLKRLRLLQWQLIQVLTIWLGTLALLLLVAFIGKISDGYSRGWALAWVGTVAFLLVIARGALHFALSRCVAAGSLARSIAIVGVGAEAQRLITKLQASPEPGFVLYGVFDDRGLGLSREICGLSILGTTDDLINLSRRDQVEEIIIALPLEDQNRLAALFSRLKGVAVDLRLSLEPLAERFTVRGINFIGRVPVLEIANKPFKHWRGLAKWAEDKMLSAVLLLWLAPLMICVALLIKLETPGPLFFVQRRFGFNNNEISVLKFRTMHVGRGDPSGALRTVRNDSRVTRVGRVLRALSLDELPQLINVLRGDMSLVGPRPHAIAMKAGDRLYHDAVEDYAHRHRVKPGITGWAQVNGLRGEVDTLEKARARVAHDLYYIENWTLWLDIKVLLMTIGLLLRERAY
jgi:Undecaprenyl-phosphate glucose phosphotransferase